MPNQGNQTPPLEIHVNDDKSLRPRNIISPKAVRGRSVDTLRGCWQAYPQGIQYGPEAHAIRQWHGPSMASKVPLNPRSQYSQFKHIQNHQYTKIPWRLFFHLLSLSWSGARAWGCKRPTTKRRSSPQSRPQERHASCDGARRRDTVRSDTRREAGRDPGRVSWEIYRYYSMFITLLFSFLLLLLLNNI